MVIEDSKDGLSKNWLTLTAGQRYSYVLKDRVPWYNFQTAGVAVVYMCMLRAYVANILTFPQQVD